MKITIDKNKYNINAEQFLRRNGYAFIVDRRRGKESFVRRMGAGHYPRFHVYIKREDNRIIFDMHLDQKQASYEGSHMHNAEYDGNTVQAETNRLKSLIANEYKKSSIQNIKKEPEKEEGLTKRFFKAFFG
ncbi:MAG: hypothetical protein PF572_01455 [Patescibacteria group bacterium]|jgi:hypothetical protein|nr:hypothetical protein [Patescibacteria group bacterium]